MSSVADCVFCANGGGEVLWRDDRLRIVRAGEPDHPGLLRVIWHAHVREMTDLPSADRRHLMDAVFAAEQALRDVLGPLKINLASFGNMVPHLHWHVIPRHEDDPHFPNAIWGARQREGALGLPVGFVVRVASRLDALLGVAPTADARNEESVRGFYDGMAGQYHEMFADWQADVRTQAVVLERLLVAGGPPGPWRILDCACGIGTQAIGFALIGHSVHATDLSPAPLERARREADAFGVRLSFGVADFVDLAGQVPDVFDVVVCADNAIAHLLDDELLTRALVAMRSRLAPGGRLVLTLRDYDRLQDGSAEHVDPGLPGIGQATDRRLPAGTMPRVFDEDGGRRIAFQVWDWDAAGHSYAVHQFFLNRPAGATAYRVAHHLSRFRALRRTQLEAALRRAGFARLNWHLPPQSGFYQPLVIAA